tara:strand:- start:573 stop:827 length:255 start_codon:yes stop_codon:yes gene_type:complete
MNYKLLRKAYMVSTITIGAVHYGHNRLRAYELKCEKKGETPRLNQAAKFALIGGILGGVVGPIVPPSVCLWLLYDTIDEVISTS